MGRGRTDRWGGSGTVTSAGMADPWTPTDGEVTIIGALDASGAITGGSLVSDTTLGIAGAITGATTIDASGAVTAAGVIVSGANTLAFSAATGGRINFRADNNVYIRELSGALQTSGTLTATTTSDASLGSATVGWQVINQNRNAIGAVSTDAAQGQLWTNNTAAAAGAQQYSPMTVLEGQGWKTDATAATQEVQFGTQVIPIQGAANPTGAWALFSNINDAGFVERFRVGSDGTVTLIDAANIVVNETTGTKIATATTQKLGFWNKDPVVQPSAYTQTYSTANKTLGSYTPDDESAAYTGAADGEAKLTDLNALRVAYENLRAFAEDAVQMLNSVVDDLQVTGFVG